MPIFACWRARVLVEPALILRINQTVALNPAPTAGNLKIKSKVLGSFFAFGFSGNLKSQPNDALELLVKNVGTVDTVDTVKNAETVKTVEIVETVDISTQ